MNEMVEVLLVNAIKATILAGGIGLLSLHPVVRHFANIQHTLWLLVLLAMVAPPIFELPLIKLPAVDLPMHSLSESPIETTKQPQVEQKSIPQLNHSLSAEQFASPVSGHTASEPDRFYGYVLCVILSGSVVVVVRAVVAARRLRRMLRLAMPASQRVAQIATDAGKAMDIGKCIKAVVVDSKISPFMWTDVSCIYVVLPKVCESSDQEELQCIVLHELAHYARRDHWSNFIAMMVLAICWWNPVAWLATHRMRTLQEYCCDAVAMSKSKIARREYAECLFKIVEYIQPTVTRLPVSACEFLGRNKVEERFKMIANSRLRFEATRWNYLLVAAFCVLVPCSAAYAQKDLESQLDQDRIELKKSLDAAQSNLQLDHQTKPGSQQENEELRKITKQFDELIGDSDWKKAEQLANDTAKKFGHEDALVQHMLLQSVNAVRKSQGLAPILVEKIFSEPKHELIQVSVHPLDSFLPADETNPDKFVKLLLECLSATIADSQEKPTKLIYVEEIQLLIVKASPSQQELVSKILERVSKKQTSQ